VNSFGEVLLVPLLRRIPEGDSDLMLVHPRAGMTSVKVIKYFKNRDGATATKGDIMPRFNFPGQLRRCSLYGGRFPRCTALLKRPFSATTVLKRTPTNDLSMAVVLITGCSAGGIGATMYVSPAQRCNAFSL
jgi:hypothetical protein